MGGIIVPLICLGAIGSVVIVLVIAFFCFKKKMCWCQRNKIDAAEEEDEITNEALLGVITDDGDDGERYSGGELKIDERKYSGGKSSDGGKYSGGKSSDGGKYSGGKSSDGGKSSGGKFKYNEGKSKKDGKKYTGGKFKDERGEHSGVKSTGEGEFPALPYDKVQLTVNKRYDDFNYVPNYDSSDRYTDDDEIFLAEEGEDVLGALPLPATHLSVRTGTYSSAGTDSRFDSNEFLGRRRMRRDTFIDGCKLRLSLMYSAPDMFLMLTIMDVTGMPPRKLGGYKFIRIAIALLPERKYHSTTKIQQVTGEEFISFGDSFKFSGVSRDNLFTSAFRFRLYGRNNRAREVCAGEFTIQLADLVQRSYGFVATRHFERKQRSSGSLNLLCFGPIIDTEKENQS